MLDVSKCHCPYCGELIELVIDTSVEDQEYIEDCSVCCRPIIINSSVIGEEIHVEVRSEDE